MIKEMIKKTHSGDQDQINTIFSNNKYLVVEAPAGYGKTKTMISRIAYLIATRRLHSPKKILALTFSVNAAYKIKRDVAENLPTFLATENMSPVQIGSCVLATNYHGFCRRVLKLYGYIIDHLIKEIDLFLGVDDHNVDNLLRLNIGISRGDAEQLVAYNQAIKSRNTEFIKRNFNTYLDIIKEFFLEKKIIPFNAILLLVFKLFQERPKILEFYRKNFPIIIVDEFQDTNVISWNLITKLIGDNNEILFMGDSLQRIYGFIGAIPGLIGRAQAKYNAEKIEFKKNYRFANNQNLLLLDKNIRANTQDPRNPIISENAKVHLIEYENQDEEANGIVDLTMKFVDKDSMLKIAILVKQRGRNTNKILEAFSNRSIEYFYALYSDEDQEYIEFHNRCLGLFIEVLKTTAGKFTRNSREKYISNVEESYRTNQSEINLSLIKLLKTFINAVFTQYNFLTIEDKIELIKDTLENKALKQYLGYVDSQIVISTVHGAKGLEWGNVILPDMEQYTFPSWLGLCGDCFYKSTCDFKWERIGLNSIIENKFYDELSVFYVAATRAQKKLCFTYSKRGINFSGNERTNNLSCFLKLPGIDTA